MHVRVTRAEELRTLPSLIRLAVMPITASTACSGARALAQDAGGPATRS